MTLTLRELLTYAIQHGHMDEPVEFYAWTVNGGYRKHVVADFTADQRAGRPRNAIDITAIEDDV